MLIYHSDLKQDLAIARQHNMDLINSGHITEDYYSLENRLEYLKTGGNFNSNNDPDSMRCHLYSDFVQYSFGWTWYKEDNVNGLTAIDYPATIHPELVGYRRVMNGGLIFHRDYSQDDPTIGSWSIHT